MTLQPSPSADPAASRAPVHAIAAASKLVGSRYWYWFSVGVPSMRSR